METRAYLSKFNLEGYSDVQIRRAVVESLPRWSWMARAIAEHGSKIVQVSETIDHTPGPGDQLWASRKVSLVRPQSIHRCTKAAAGLVWHDGEKLQVQLR